MFSWIESHPELGKVDVCINNAGLSTSESLAEGSIEALSLCTQLSVQSMTKHGVDDGQIVMVNSFSGHRLAPNPSTRYF